MRTFLSAVLALVVSTVGGGMHPAEAFQSTVEPAPETDEVTSSFGIATEKFSVQEGRVGRAQTFADLLTSYGVSYRTAVQVAEAAQPDFDVRDMRTGQPYRVYMNPWLQQAQYLVYEIDAVQYVVFDIQNPSQSRVERKPIRRTWRRVEGTIESSLYETLTEKAVHPDLVLRLAEVFAWQIDFFRIRRGDSFRILYEERRVDGERVVPGEIVAVYFRHRGEDYYGFRFDDGNGAKYYDRQGQSLQRQLLKAPLRYTRISSGYTNSRRHPVHGRRQPHRGTDYAAPPGTPVRAVGGGTVVQAGYYGNNGNYVKIRHNETYTSGYLHLARIASGIEPGAEVQQGDQIGTVGSTGLSTGPHLDYRLWKRGQPVDPYELDLPPSEPVPPQHRAAFNRLVEDRLARLHPLRVFQNGDDAQPLSL